MTWDEAGTLAFYALTIVSILFVLTYHVLSPWWRTEAGRNIMAVMASLAAIGAWGSYVNLLADPRSAPLFYPTRFFLFSGLTLAIGWRIVILVRAQLARRRRGRDEVH